MSTSLPRRRLLTHSLALGAGLALPPFVLAQTGPIKLGTLTPLTGAGGPYGPAMVTTVKAVIDEVNAAGGVLGRQLVLVSEDREIGRYQVRIFGSEG